MNSELPTELALASDGTLYVTAEGRDPRQFAGRKRFVGYALRKGELLVKLAPARVFGWVVLGRAAIGSDGKIYVNDEKFSTGRRKVFRGFAVTPEQRERIVRSLHHTAPSIVMDASLPWKHGVGARRGGR